MERSAATGMTIASRCHRHAIQLCHDNDITRPIVKRSAMAGEVRCDAT